MTKMMQSQQPTTKMMNNATGRAHRALRVATTALILSLGVATLSIASPLARAQQRGPVHRTVEGRVHDANDAPVKGAVVYLKDSRTLAVKSFLSDDEGNFHFGQLSTNSDYEVYAEFQGKRSKSKSVSSFDSKNDFNFTLKLDK